MTDTELFDTTDRITEQAREGLVVIDDQIEAMRQQREGLRVAIADALERRKPLARIVAAMEPRKPRTRKAVTAESNGDD